MKIADKISSYFFTVAIVLTLVASSIFYFIIRNNIISDRGQELEALARFRAQHISTYLQLLRHSMSNLSVSIVIEDLLKTDDKNSEDGRKKFNVVMRRLKDTQKITYDFYDIFVIDKNGKVVVSSDEKDIGADKTQDVFFIAGQKEIYKDAYYSSELKRPMIAVSVPILNRDTGEFLGVLVSNIDLIDLYKIIMDRVGLDETSEIYAVNKYGYMVTPSRFLKDTFLKQKVNTKGSNMALSHFLSSDKKLHSHEHREKTLLYRDYRGIDVMGSYSCVSEAQWVVLAEVSVQEAFAPLFRVRMLILVILLVLSLAAWLSGVYISEIIARPILKLHEATEIIGAGNLNYKVATDSKDEIGQLSRAFDKMSGKLKQTTISLDSLNKEIIVRERVEKALQESEEKYRSIFESSRDAMMTLEPPFWKFTSGNLSMLRMFKVKDEAELALSESWMLSPERQPDGRISKEKAMEMIETAMREGSNFFEWTHKRANGDVFSAEVLLTRVEGSGKTFLQATVRDITERKEMVEMLQRSGERYQILFDASPDAVVLFGIYGRIILVNEAAVKMFGYDNAENIFGKNLSDFIAVKDRERLEESIKKVLEGSETVKVEEYKGLVKYGAMLDMEVNISLIRDADGHPDVLLAIVTDVSERKYLERLKDDFLSTISHELRTPLVSIKEGISVVLDKITGPINEKQEECLNIAKKNVDRLARLISGVLDFQKLKSGAVEFKMEENDMNEFIIEVCKSMLPMVVKKGLELGTNFEGEPFKIKFDKDRITQVLTNLINNAVKFTEKGSISVCAKKWDSFIQVSVKDTGRGIEQENIPKLFHKFIQVQRKPAAGGAGLGLVICQEIIEAHKGKIWIESVFGEGTTVNFTLPIVR